MLRGITLAILTAAILVLIGGVFYFLKSKESEPQREPDKDVFCIQVITKARNPETGEEKDFPTPCDVPPGWEIVQSSSVEEEKSSLESKTEVLNSTLATGEVLIVEFSEAPEEVIFDGRKFSPFPYRESWRAVVPVPLGTQSGDYKLTVGPIFEANITVAAKEQLVINLPPPPKLGLTDKQIVQNLSTSNTDLRKIVAEIEEITRFDEPFDSPVEDTNKISSPFGEIRQTGDQSIIHLGVDFDVPKGTPVYAINSGAVKNAYLDSIYGNSVIIDHGRGIFSLYLHLDSMSVKAGDLAQKGEMVGRAGESGLASAPHLHLSLKINGVSVDPMQFISVFR